MILECIGSGRLGMAWLGSVQVHHRWRGRVTSMMMTMRMPTPTLTPSGGDLDANNDKDDDGEELEGLDKIVTSVEYCTTRRM